MCLLNRLAADVGVSKKAGDTESLNNPVSKSRLIEMYRKVRLLQWPKIKDYLKSNKMRPEITKALIQVVYDLRITLLCSVFFQLLFKTWIMFVFLN